jgi:hypothetical protein
MGGDNTLLAGWRKTGMCAIFDMPAQEGAGLENRPLPGREEVPTSLHTRPATPVAGEAWGQGVRSCTTSSLLQSTPGEGKAGRREEEVRASGGVDPLGCWVPSLLLPPLSRVGGGGGAVSRGGARV